MRKNIIKPLTDTPFNRALAAGHRKRTGHELDAVLVLLPGTEFPFVVDICCGEDPETFGHTESKPTPDR